MSPCLFVGLTRSRWGGVGLELGLGLGSVSVSRACCILGNHLPLPAACQLPMEGTGMESSQEELASGLLLGLSEHALGKRWLPPRVAQPG